MWREKDIRLLSYDGGNSRRKFDLLGMKRKRKEEDEESRGVKKTNAKKERGEERREDKCNSKMTVRQMQKGVHLLTSGQEAKP